MSLKLQTREQQLRPPAVEMRLLLVVMSQWPLLHSLMSLKLQTRETRERVGKKKKNRPHVEGLVPGREPAEVAPVGEVPKVVPSLVPVQLAVVVLAEQPLRKQPTRVLALPPIQMQVMILMDDAG